MQTAMGKREERKALERDRQRNDIFDAALEVLAREGFAGASMNEIAAISGYSVGHVYNVIGNKKTLFDEVVLREGRELTGLINDTLVSYRTRPAVSCVDALVDVILDFFDSHRAFFQIFLNEARGVHPGTEHQFSQNLVALKKEAGKDVRKLFARAAAEGDLADLDLNDASTYFLELIKGFIAAWALKGYRGRISKKAVVIKRLLWKGICG